MVNINEIEDESITSKAIPANHKDEKDPYSEGLYVLEITSDQVNEYGLFLDDFYQKVRDNHKRQVTRTALTMIKGAIFAVGTKELNNPEWQEHCASSLREIFHEWKDGQMESDFNDFYKEKGIKLTPDESETFREFRLHYKYFSGIDHHEASTILGSLSAILNNKSLKLKDCYKEKIFLERVKNFFLILSQIINYSAKKA